MKPWLIAAACLFLVLPVVAVWCGRARRRFDEPVTPRWLNEHAYEKDGDRR